MQVSLAKFGVGCPPLPAAALGMVHNFTAAQRLLAEVTPSDGAIVLAAYAAHASEQFEAAKRLYKKAGLPSLPLAVSCFTLQPLLGAGIMTIASLSSVVYFSGESKCRGQHIALSFVGLCSGVLPLLHLLCPRHEEDMLRRFCCVLYGVHKC